MNLTLIMPSIGRKPGRSYISTWQMEPLVLAVLAGLTPPDWKITVFDDRVEPINFEHPSDLVAISVETYTARRAYQISSEFRKRGIKVVMGGYHATLFPEEVAENSDSVVIGEAENVWKDVLDDSGKGEMKPRYQGESKFEKLKVFPRREIYSEKKYLPLALVEFSRGCRFSCNFCSITRFYGANHRFRPVDDVVAEIKASGQKTVFIIDDNIAANPEAAMELFSALKPLRINWVSQMSVNFASQPKMVKAMAESGCMGLLIGFESLQPEQLAKMNKRCNGPFENYDRALRLLRENNICLYATFLFGNDGDTPGSFFETMKFIRKYRPFLVAFNHLVPFPGTPLYSRLENENRLSSKAWWLDPNFRFGQVAFQPYPMSAIQVAELCRKFRKKFYSLRSIFHRGLDFKTNSQSLKVATLYFTQNYFGRREVEEKFGLPLGFVDPILKGRDV